MLNSFPIRYHLVIIKLTEKELIFLSESPCIYLPVVEYYNDSLYASLTRLALVPHIYELIEWALVQIMACCLFFAKPLF